MGKKERRKPFVNAANKTAYIFADGMGAAEAYRALLDPTRHSETDETYQFAGEIYRVVRVAGLGKDGG
jgi:hypothetical protein